MLMREATSMFDRKRNNLSVDILPAQALAIYKGDRPTDILVNSAY